ncbi:hypothetical protein ZWY2020_060127 [Hordeum vulgare]|nr:hypothetical protein ZWY2020_060127 [Hordeum vulgare]
MPLLGTLSAPGSTAVAMGGIGQLRSRGTSIGVSRPQPDVNFTIGVIGAVWCKHCRYAGYLPSKNVAPSRTRRRCCGAGEGGRPCRRGRDGRAGLLHDRDGGAGGAVREQGLRGVRAVCRFARRGACGVAVLPRRNQGTPLRFREYVTRPDGLQALYTAGNFVFGPRDPAKCSRVD